MVGMLVLVMKKMNVFAANHDWGTKTNDSTEEAIDIAACSATYQSIIV